MRTIIWLGMAVQVAFLGISSAATMNYQGRLTGTNGTPVSGSVAVSVNLYANSVGGTALYTENMGSVAVANGIFSFDWGMAGTSSVMVIEDIATTTGSNSVYNGTSQHTPMNSGEVAIADGTYVWTDTTGSSSPSDFLGTVSSYSNGTVSAVYLSGNPPAGRVIKIAYRYPVMGCAATIQAYSNIWLGVTIDGSEMIPRKVLGSVPRSVVANTVKGQTLYVDDLTGRVGIGTNNPSSSLTVNGIIESTSGGIKFPDGTVLATGSGSQPTTNTVVCGPFQNRYNVWSEDGTYGTYYDFLPLYIPNGALLIHVDGQLCDLYSFTNIRASLVRVGTNDVAEALASWTTAYEYVGKTNVSSSIPSNSVVDLSQYYYGVEVLRETDGPEPNRMWGVGLRVVFMRVTYVK